MEGKPSKMGHSNLLDNRLLNNGLTVELKLPQPPPPHLPARRACLEAGLAPESGGHIALKGGVKRHLHSDVGQQGDKLTENPARETFIALISA